MDTQNISARLEELRAAIRAESISYGELFELQGLAEHIDHDDVELLEAAGVPEFPEDAAPLHAPEQFEHDNYPTIMVYQSGDGAWVVEIDTSSIAATDHLGGSYDGSPNMRVWCNDALIMDGERVTDYNA